MRFFSFKTFLVIFFSAVMGVGGERTPKVEIVNLDNGMKVVMQEDHSSPLVCVMICVKVGSAYESQSTNGLSHFLEHLLFDGTSNRSREEIKKTFDQNGIYFNAFTREDFTAYEIVAPKEMVKIGIEVQADMILNSILPETEFKKERNVVIEEIKKDSDNPETYSWDLFRKRFYKGTSYSRPVIGYPSIIQTISRESVMKFYTTHYIPNKMVGIVIGDFESREMIDIFKKIYGTLPPSEIQDFQEMKSLPIKGIEKSEVEFPTKGYYVNIGFKAPKVTEKYAVPFELLSQILIGGKDSRIYRALIIGPNSLAEEVNGGYIKLRENCAFSVSFIVSEEWKIEPAIKLIEKELEKIKSEFVSEEEIRRSKTVFATENVFSTERFVSRAREFAYWEGIASYERRRDFFDGVPKVSTKEIMECAKQFFSKRDFVVTVVKPQRETASLERKVSSIITRKKVFENGLTLIVREDPYTEVIATNVLIKNRMQLEPEGLNGIGNILQRMIDKGTNIRSKEQIIKEIAEIGLRLKTTDDPMMNFDDYYFSKDYSYLRMESINLNRERAWELLLDMIKNPTFPAEELEKEKENVINIIKRKEFSTMEVASKLFYNALFPHNVYKNSILGSTESIKKIQRDDIISYWKKAYAPNNLIISVITDKNYEQVFKFFSEHCESMKRIESFPIVYTKEEVSKGPKRENKYVEKEQGYIFIGNLIPGIQNPDVPSLQLMNEILSSRLKLNIRERQGLAYSVGSSVNFSKDIGWLVVSLGTRNENVEIAVQSILEEMEKLKEEEPTQEELTTVINSFWGEYLRYRQTKINQAHYLALYEFLGVGWEFDETYIDKLRKVKREDVLQTAKKYLDTKNYTLSVAGKIGKK